MGTSTVTSLALLPDRTTVQLLDVRDPQNVSQAWDLEPDGWLRASRFIGDTLYVVLAVPIDVFATTDPLDSRRFLWTYSGLHLFDISGVDAGEPQLRFNSLTRADEPGSPRASPPVVIPNRSILHKRQRVRDSGAVDCSWFVARSVSDSEVVP